MMEQTVDPRIAAALARAAQSEGHPRTLYAALAWNWARDAGDMEAMQRAIELGAFLYRRAAPVYARTEDAEKPDRAPAEPVQMAMW